MDGGDGRHVPSCREVSHRTIINPTMTLRFRPIAPKPATGGAFPGGIWPEKATVFSAGKRVKRKYVRVKKGDNNPRKRNGNGSSEGNGKSVTVPLQLMPEKSDGYESPESLGSPSPLLCGATTAKRGEETAGASDRAVAESWVTVEECVADTCMDARGLGSTDAERVRNLESDACPGFVSDGALSRVEWVNEAYRGMVAASHHGSGGGQWPEVVVRLSTASKLGRCMDGPGFFTCRVRVQYYVKNNSSDNNKEKCWKVMPCDVWRLDCGGFAWRLDVKAALSLGL